MFVFDITNPITLVLLIIATLLLMFLAHEIKKSAVTACVLIVYVGLLLVHVLQITSLSEEFQYLSTVLTRCIVVDFCFVLVSFLGYLFIDDVEAKVKKKDVISKSPDWFWKEV